jgi:hypothetical protein
MTPREIREQQRHFKILGTQIIAFLAQIERLMLEPESRKRGEAIAVMCNALEMANDSAMRFGLGLQRKGVKLTKLKRPILHEERQDV